MFQKVTEFTSRARSTVKTDQAPAGHLLLDAPFNLGSTARRHPGKRRYYEGKFIRNEDACNLRNV